jgi:hypothetical protein
MQRPCLLFLLFAAALPAQTTTGQIFGTTTDPTQSAVAGVEIAVVNEASGVRRQVTSSAEGFYLAANLEPGRYRVEAAKAGFKQFVRAGITLTAGERVEAKVQLALGDVTERVDVRDTGATIETASGAVSQLVEGAQLRDIALNGRNIVQLLMVMPGVASTGDEFDRGGIAFGNFGGFNVNGMRSTSMQTTLDGGNNQDSGNITSMTNNIGVDFVQEVKAVTSGYSAEFGRFAGGQVNFTTRSGTEQFHGALFEFFRNDKLNARSFFAPTKEKLRLNNFGWTFGGWVPLPGISTRGGRKLFFFAGQEYKRRVDGDTRLATMPTRAERAGIMRPSTATFVYPSNFPVAALRGTPIEDPARATPDNPTGRNILPQRYITTNGAAMMRVFQTMETQASRYIDEPLANNTTFQLANTDRRREDILRLDYALSPQHNLSFRWVYDSGDNFVPYETGNIPTFRATRQNRTPNYQATWTYSLSPTRVNEFAAAATHLFLERVPNDDFRLPSTYGFTNRELFGNEQQVYGIPSYAIAGFTTISGARINPYSPVADYTLRDTFTWIKGKHQLKFGGLAIRNDKNERITGSLPGQFSFQNQGNSLSTGSPLLDAQLGNFFQYSEADADKFVYTRFYQTEGFVADTWRARKNLTLDLGVRYYRMGAPYDRYNTLSTFLADRFDPAQAQRVIPSGVGAGELQAGVGRPNNGLILPGGSFPSPGRVTERVRNLNLFAGFPRGLFSTEHRLSPRFGFAYDFGGRADFVVRGGIGIFYDRLATGRSVEAGGNPPFVQTVTLFEGSVDDPAGGRRQAQFPVSIASLRPDIRTPETYNWNFGFQKKLFLNSIVDVNYVSTQGRGLLRRPDINQVSPAVRAANLAPNINSLRPFPGYTTIRLYESGASSSYHGLQMGWSRRYATDLTFSVAYTWSKVITDASADGSEPENTFDYRRERARANFDRNHVLVFSYIYNLPFFRGRNHAAGRVLGGWQLSGLTQVQSGPWLTPTINTPTGTRRPDSTGAPVRSLNPRDFQTLTGGNGQAVAGNFFFDPRPGGSFVAPPNERFGNTGPSVVLGPGRANWDVSLFKTFAFTEDWRLQFRAEAFNLFNYAQFRAPNMNASDRAYGTVSATGPPRLMQLGLKLLF